MQLSRGWWKLVLPWAVAVSICVISGGILRFIVPVNQDDAAAVEQHALPRIHTASAAGSADDAGEPGYDSLPTMQVLTANYSNQARREDDELLASQPVGQEETKRDSPQTTSGQEKRLNLRITRDSERCPKVICYKWHLITQRLQPPHYTKVELAGLRLAPSLRQKVDKGNIDLLIDAVTQHRKINGHDTLIFVAINLEGVTPHNTPP